MLCSLRDSIAGTSGGTSSAADAGIGNFISHQKHLHSFVVIIVTYFFKKASKILLQKVQIFLLKI